MDSISGYVSIKIICENQETKENCQVSCAISDVAKSKNDMDIEASLELFHKSDLTLRSNATSSLKLVQNSKNEKILESLQTKLRAYLTLFLSYDINPNFFYQGFECKSLGCQTISKSLKPLECGYLGLLKLSKPMIDQHSLHMRYSQRQIWRLNARIRMIFR